MIAEFSIENYFSVKSVQKSVLNLHQTHSCPMSIRMK